MIYSLDGIAPDVADSAWVAPSCHIIGKVTLAENSSVWFGTTIRGDNERITLGKGSNTQENSVLHTDPGCPLTIAENCTIGHNAILHGCTIGENSLIGMGAIVLNRAVIGRNCLIAAGAIIPEGREIPDGSLVIGAPGKVVRQLDEAAIANLRASAEKYQQNARRFRDTLTKV
ncbi:gamma carbonic anhydrase family protein [Flavimaricola marinus]|uniref:2,3,4,5-tetrahydropyridine-2,6-dicarboxylate N-acetyltransferase n=1 Tax=Flavimaricola marinus TaxID=1819565 RepID=A0A238LCJ4_9RHOB|nr:gamma carbonic anhydrase family protein [Flavimaricola marinus]SMY07409.1 2,3,4,5-tetrahydropyridine-2,6-dicarboxylate N-acetyltransferase [Flavimaricola marinus]